MCRVWRRTRSSPSSRMPVPASRTSALSPPSTTSTQEVLPPYTTVPGPGAGTEPRHPQIFSCTGTKLVAPEDHDDADELLVVREQRERRHLELALDPVRARDAIPEVGCTALVQRDAGGPLLGRDRVRGERPRLERTEPVVDRHLPHLCETPADHALRGFVVEDEVSARVGDQGRRRQVRHELPREDQSQMLLSLRVHVSVPLRYF